jgi:predicted ATPase/DNA-binding SARP family transcriptional activator
VEFRILGPLEVADEGRAISLEAAKPRALLGVLLLHPNEVVSSERLIDELWGEQPPATAAKIVQTYVSQLRRALGPDVIVTRPPGYLLPLAEEALDAARFRLLSAEARRLAANGAPEQAERRYREALALWRGPPLADLAFASFARNELEQLAEERLEALNERIDCRLALGHHEQLSGELEALVEQHPYRERLRAQLMLALYRSGRQAEALAAYQDARRILSEELGLEPSSELQELERAILKQDPGLAVTPRSLGSLNRTNLPAQPSRLIGRKRELEELVALVSESRLVTLTGAGGSGKTRLALETASELVDRFEAGVAWVPLAAVGDPELVVPAIAQTIGARASLPDHIADAQLLLLLDNLEQVVDAAPHLSELLGRCPNLHLLTTSRAPLRIAGEREYRVDPLPEDDAVTLFGERAADPQPLETAREICRRLDGLPLAIELAAARTRLLPPDKLLERLDRALPLLTGGRRDAPERQRTLRATIAWSHDLLDPDERRLFAHLAAFVGGFTLEAAEEIASGDVGTLESLLEKNLLRREERRFHMLETIREYAAERLDESSEKAEVRMLHATYFCALAEQACLDDPTRDDQAYWLDRLDAEHDNLRSALDFAVSQGLADLEVRLVMSLRSFWFLRGYWTEGRARLEHALELPVAERPEVRTGLLNEAAQLAERQGDFARARLFTSQHLALARELGDERNLAEAHMRAGIASAAQDDLDAAQAHFREVLSLSRRTEDKWFAARARLNLGFCFVAADDLVQAEHEFERSIALARAVTNKGLLASCLCGLSFAQLASGRADQARPRLKEALLLAIEIRSPEHIASALSCLGRALATGERPEEGARLLGVALCVEKDLSYVATLPTFRTFRELTETILCKRLGAERYNAALDEGADLGILPGAAYAIRIAS